MTSITITFGDGPPALVTEPDEDDARPSIPALGAEVIDTTAAAADSLWSAFEASLAFDDEPYYAPFFEWLSRTLSLARTNFRKDELPPPLQGYFGSVLGGDYRKFV